MIAGDPAIPVGYVPAINMGTDRCEQSDIARLTAVRCGSSLLWLVCVSPLTPLGEVHDPVFPFSVWLRFSLSTLLSKTPPSPTSMLVEGGGVLVLAAPSVLPVCSAAEGAVPGGRMSSLCLLKDGRSVC